MNPVRVAVLTLSDRCSRGEAVDTSGPALAEMARQRLGAEVVAQTCVPDDRATIAQVLRRWVDESPKPDLILTTGGTGLAPRDVTPEATLEVLDRRHSGLMELVRRRCYDQTPRAYLSRGEAGARRRTLIINLPGSQRGATESLEALLDILPHALETLRGEVQDDGRPDAVASTGKVVRHKDER
jgi:molybdopterin adenylyltransferase